MGLGLTPGTEIHPSSQLRSVVCDLGCGDGDFLVNLLNHLNTDGCSVTAVHGVGVDYDAQLLKSAAARSGLAGQSVQWLEYDFNEDINDLASQLLDIHHITHVFIYLLPKQLELQKVRQILTRLCERLAKFKLPVHLDTYHYSGVTICCHKYQPAYLTGMRHNVLMDLVVYGNSLILAGDPAALVSALSKELEL